jgi:ribosome maturation factor RimP
MGFGPVFYLWVNVMDVSQLVGTTLAGLGYELVDLEISGRGMVRVFIDLLPEGQSGAGAQHGGITLDDCERVSNQLTRLFAVEGVAYDRLEVSSPGLDRPLKKEADFVRFRGERASLKLRIPLDGRKNFVGMLGEVRDGMLELDMDGKRVQIALSNVDKARLSPVF